MSYIQDYDPRNPLQVQAQGLVLGLAWQGVGHHLHGASDDGETQHRLASGLLRLSRYGHDFLDIE